MAKPGECAHDIKLKETVLLVCSGRCNLAVSTVCLTRCDGASVDLRKILFWYWFEPRAESGMIDHASVHFLLAVKKETRGRNGAK